MRDSDAQRADRAAVLTSHRAEDDARGRRGRGRGIRRRIEQSPLTEERIQRIGGRLIDLAGRAHAPLGLERTDQARGAVAVRLPGALAFDEGRQLAPRHGVVGE